MAGKRPPWAPQELRRRGLHSLVRSTEGKPGELHVAKGTKTGGLHAVKRTKTPRANGSHHDHDTEEDAEILIVCNPNKFQDDMALVSVLKDCAERKDLSRGSKIHGDILKNGLLKKNMFIGNTLVNM
eukprot:c20242_g1_i1 orf=276-656(+)